jgi:two-component system, cell cycle sensor histidine kinase and response regulator CckA
LIEDNPGDARLIQEMLNEQNIEMELDCCSSLKKGIEHLQGKQVDAILLDLNLPDSQGLETFDKLNSFVQAIPIVILTGYTDDSFALDAVHRGAQDYIIKGEFNSQLLLRALRYAIERKKADEAITRQAELIDLSPDGIIIRKIDGIITFWSKGAERLYGWTEEEALGKDTHDLLKTIFHSSLASLDKELAKNGYWSGELTQSTKFDKKVIVQSYWKARKDKNDNVIEVFESSVDITKQKNSERLATIGRTAGMVGHDIRNPLQAIVCDLYLAKTELINLHDSESKAKAIESLDEIQANVDYINKIVQDLQDFGRILNPCIEEANIQLIIDDVLASQRIPENIHIVINVEENSQIVILDPDFIKRIADNLILNAIQAMPNGGKLTVEAKKDKQTNDILLIVDDTGIGIPESIKSEMFTPMFTTKSKGQGFGLAVVKRMVEALGGTVTFESEAGKGTKFIVRFPPPKS